MKVRKLLSKMRVAIGTHINPRPGTNPTPRPCIECGQPVYCGDARSQRIPDWCCIVCLTAALEQYPDENWKFILPEGMTPQMMAAFLKTGALPWVH